MNYSYTNYQLAATKLASLLNISYSPYSQDWEIESADDERIEEFCEVYKSKNLSPDEQHILLHIIIASLDDRMRLSQTNTKWLELEDRITEIIVSNTFLHKDTVEYWSRFDVNTPEDDWSNPEWVFAVTPFIRRVWQLCYGQ